MKPRRIARRAALTITTLIILVEVVHLFVDSPGRFHEIYGGAVQIAYPEHYIVDSDANFSLITTTLTFWADSYGPSTSGYLNGSVRMSAFRSLSISPLPDTKMTAVLRSFRGGQGTEVSTKHQARAELSKLPDNAFATAVVELATPMDEREMEVALAGYVDTRTDTVYLFLSGLEPGMRKPVFWRSCAIYRSECANRSSLDLYRRWVSRLSWFDGIGLTQMGLNAERLRQAAREGRIYGLLTYGYPKKRLLEMLDLRAVRAIHVAETRTIG
ncbi:hypothetical protein ACIBEJ_27075 [Nonomuraea sp. NPDC050790]|uniref:hypothetical protein n=1 Tax=Nonomuraea sp. NPDC050790 TaxID=3364371 RepID=UPI00378D8A22